MNSIVTGLYDFACTGANLEKDSTTDVGAVVEDVLLVIRQDAAEAKMMNKQERLVQVQRRGVRRRSAAPAVRRPRSEQSAAQPSMLSAIPPDALRRKIQRRLAPRKGNGAISSETVHAAAEAGIQGAGGARPHLEQIQKSFGHHDVSGIQAHTGLDSADEFVDEHAARLFRFIHGAIRHGYHLVDQSFEGCDRADDCPMERVLVRQSTNASLRGEQLIELRPR